MNWKAGDEAVINDPEHLYHGYRVWLHRYLPVSESWSFALEKDARANQAIPAKNLRRIDRWVYDLAAKGSADRSVAIRARTYPDGRIEILQEMVLDGSRAEILRAIDDWQQSRPQARRVFVALDVHVIHVTVNIGGNAPREIKIFGPVAPHLVTEALDEIDARPWDRHVIELGGE